MALEPTAAVVRHLADCYGLTIGDRAALTPVARGAMGRIWRLDTGLGPVLAVKELLWGADEEAVRAEVAFQDAATADGRIEAPASHRGVDGTYLCEIPDGVREMPDSRREPPEGIGLVRLFDWAEGEPVTTPDRVSAGWLGRTLGRLHGLGHPAGDASPDPWYWRCPSESDWRALRDTQPARTGALPAALPRLVALANGVTPDDGPLWIYCHLDLQPSNVLTRGSGPDRRFTLLDWENAGPGTPERELAAALLAWYVDDAALAVTLREYRRAGGPVAVLSPAAFSMAVATRINYGYVQARASLDAELSPADRGRAGEQCAQTLASLPAPEFLAGLLATANSSLGAIEA
jgi:hypothetical protein